MDIVDFLPKYPNIYNTKYESLNPYTTNFNETIYRKKEFYDLKLNKYEAFPSEKGMLTKHQTTIARYLSSYTPYDKLILVHFMGSGKTCSTIGAIEQIRSEEALQASPIFKGAMIFAGGPNLLDNFRRELVEKCTAGQYIPENYEKLTSLEKAHRIKKLTSFYELHTFEIFAKKLKSISDVNITDNYSNRIIVIDEVHNLRIQNDKPDSIDVYNQFHRFLHLITNCKIIFLSGTPMKDGPEEIASVSNLLLPLDDQFPTGDDFLKEYTNEEKRTYTNFNPEKGIYRIKPEKINEFKHKLAGKISFLKESESSVPKEYIGKKHYGGLKHFIVAPDSMSDFQTAAYKKAFDIGTDSHQPAYLDAREATIFVYPDGSYGKEGFNKYITVQKRKNAIDISGKAVKRSDVYTMTNELKEALKGDTNEEILNKLSVYSSKYAAIIKDILETKGNCFVYSSSVQGGGAVLFGLILELFNFTRANGNENTPGLRYGILTGLASSRIRAINNRFNRKDNIHGDIIKVIIGSRTVSEGVSFNNILYEAIVTPHWNYSETAQAIARGIRLGSHNDLFKLGQNVTVKIRQCVSIPKRIPSTPKIPSIDLYMYEISEDKDISIRGFLRLLMEIAFDCALNYLRNYNQAGVAGSRECDYTTCNYMCDGIDEKLLNKELSPSELDYSTYQLYYANPKTPLIRKKIEQIFRNNIKTDLASIMNNLKDEFTQEEIRNALILIQEESGANNEFDYRTFFRIYNRSSVKNIINKIEEMFREYFRLDLRTIFTQFISQDVGDLKGVTKFEVMTALHIIISENITLRNKYGFPSYLREEKDTYFLVSNLSIQPDFYAEYYTRLPYIKTWKTYSIILSNFYMKSIPKLVNQICTSSDEKEFIKLIKTLPINIQEVFIEGSILARELGLNKGVEIRDKILSYFGGYIKKVGDIWVSTFNKKTRCLTGKEWQDCDIEQKKIIIEQENIRKAGIRSQNPYGLIGKYNPENKVFCLVDLYLEEEKRSKRAQTRKKAAEDLRLTYSGRACAKSWKIDQLIDIAVKRLKIPPPEDFMQGMDNKSLINKINNLPKSVYKPEELKKLSTDDLRRILYWSSEKKHNGSGHIKPLCEAIQAWFEEHPEYLEIDTQCGVQGKTKNLAEKKVAKNVYHVETIVPINQEEKFKSYAKQIAKLMKDCFNIDKYRLEITSDMWVLVLLRKKVISILMVDGNNNIWNVCVDKKYRNQGVATEAMKLATDTICKNRGGKRPTLQVDIRSKNALNLIDMYKSFGFVIENTDDRYTYMMHSCGK